MIKKNPCGLALIQPIRIKFWRLSRAWAFPGEEEFYGVESYLEDLLEFLGKNG